MVQIFKYDVVSNSVVLKHCGFATVEESLHWHCSVHTLRRASILFLVITQKLPCWSAYLAFMTSLTKISCASVLLQYLLTSSSACLFSSLFDNFKQCWKILLKSLYRLWCNTSYLWGHIWYYQRSEILNYLPLLFYFCNWLPLSCVLNTS